MPPSRPPSPSNSELPPVPASPTFSYASTANPIPSSFNLPLPPPPRPPHAVLTKSDLEASQEAYSTLLSSAKEYRQALAALSLSASTFGSALEACARLKEARSDALRPAGGGSMSNSFTAKGTCTADNLLSASGVHHLISNHVQILSETVYRSFEVPLLHELDSWQRHMEEEEVAYQKHAKSLSKEIRRLEKEGLRLHKQRRRDVGSLREHLVLLTSKLDGLTTLHGSHSRGLLGDCQDLSKGVVECSAGLVRAEVDIFEGLARKGWSGGGLDELLEKGRDLFANESDTVVGAEHQAVSGSATAGGGGGAGGSKIFSILPQNRSILAVDGNDAHSVHGADGRPAHHHRRNDSLLTDGLTYQSLAGAVGKDTDVLSIFSEPGGGTTGILNRSRGVRPFSPPPLERVRVSDPLEGIRPFGQAPAATATIDEERGRSRDIEPEPEPEPEPRVDAKTADDEDEDETSTLLVRDPATGEKKKKDRIRRDKEKDTESEASASERSSFRKERERRWSVTDEGALSE